jgi:hypothetical protein
MPVTSKNGIVINDAYWLRRHAVIDGVPADCVRAYRHLLNQCVAYYKKLIDGIIRSQGGSIRIPMQPELLERYLTGFSFEYHPLAMSPLDMNHPLGWWLRDGERSDLIHIFYDRGMSAVRQRYTIIHEMFHFTQTIDPVFLNFLDELIVNTTLPAPVVIKVLERTTEKATAMYLMPNDHFVKKYQEIKISGQFNPQNIARRLATAFDVSVQTATYRLQECSAEGLNDM